MATTHKGKNIKVTTVEGTQHLFINDEHIPVSTSRTGRYWSTHLPYQEFDDLHKLGKAIVDYRNLDEHRKR